MNKRSLFARVHTQDGKSDGGTDCRRLAVDLSLAGLWAVRFSCLSAFQSKKNRPLEGHPFQGVPMSTAVGSFSVILSSRFLRFLLLQSIAHAFRWVPTINWPFDFRLLRISRVRVCPPIIGSAWSTSARTAKHVLCARVVCLSKVKPKSWTIYSIWSLIDARSSAFRASSSPLPLING